MRVPFESRVLLSLAAAVVPAEFRAEWRREWDAEIWWWIGTHTGERFRLAGHCSGALCDAAYLRISQGSYFSELRRFAGSPAACLGMLALLLTAVLVGSGLEETGRLLRGKPFPGGGLVILSQNLEFMGAHYGVPAAKLADWDARAASLEGAAAYQRISRRVIQVSPKFFALLGTRASLGSLSRPDTVVLDYRFWLRQFRGDPSIVGREIRVGGAPVVVAGVLPRDFWFLDARPDFWLVRAPAGKMLVSAIARLKPQITTVQAQEELRSLAAQVAPKFSGSAVTVERVEPLAARPLSTLGIPWLTLVLGTALASFVRYRRTPVFALFFSAKAALALTFVLFAMVEFGRSWLTINSGDSNMGSGVVSLWLFLAMPAAVLFWCVRDQRQRCPICLSRLEMPVQFGSGARMLLERAGTELVCPRGHGTLFTADGADRAQQWDSMDSSWRELFVSK